MTFYSQTPTAAPAVTPSPTPAVTPTMTPAVTPAITPSTAPTKTPATRRPTATPKPTAKAKVTYNFHTLKARTVKQGKTSVTLKWSKVSKADGYIIYGSRCSKGKTYKNKLLKTIKGNKTLTWTLKKLKKGTSYKYQVKAYRTVKGKKVITDKSIVVHAVTKGGKYCVPSKVQVTKLAGKKVKNPKKALSLTLKKGKTAKITATAKPADKKKKLTRHRALCYESSNTKVAKVSKTGKVKAVKKGSCTIWVYAENGVYRTIKVKVK